MAKYAQSRQTSAGFTLIEVLVVVILIGVLAALAAPGWVTFMNRQRLSRSGEQIAQAIRLARTEAKRTGTYREVRVDTTADPPRLAVVKATAQFNPSLSLTLVPIANISTWEVLGENNIRRGILTLTDNNPNGDSILFGPKGDVVKTTFAATNPNTFPYTITVALRGAPTVKRCVRVESLLGALSQGEDSACP